jgi:hypothetical protein
MRLLNDIAGFLALGLFTASVVVWTDIAAHAF